jgi:hypothetical protein
VIFADQNGAKFDCLYYYYWVLTTVFTTTTVIFADQNGAKFDCEEAGLENLYGTVNIGVQI